MRASILTAAAVTFAVGVPAAAQQAPGREGAPAATGGEADLVRPNDPQAPALYGGETQGFLAEEFYWMNPEADRWPDDLDPRDNEYLPAPEPNVTFELDLGL